MKRTLAGVLLIPALLSAEPVQVEKKVVCDKVEIVLSALSKDYGEKPLWIGKADGSQVAVLVNLETKSWSIIQFNGQVACVLETGEKFQLQTDSMGWKSTRHIPKIVL